MSTGDRTSHPYATPHSSAAKGKLLVLGEMDYLRWRREHSEGMRPSALPYGINALEEAGVSLTKYRDRTGSGFSLMMERVERRRGQRMEQVFRALPAWLSYDAVLTLFEQFAPVVALGRRRGIWPFSKVPVCTVAVWLAQRALNADPRELRDLRSQLKHIDLIACYSSNQLDIYREKLNLPDERLVCIPFGVDVDFYKPSHAERDIEVLSVGQDHGRDYQTLFRAVGGAEFRTLVVAGKHTALPSTTSARIEVKRNIDHVEYRSLLQRARVVTVPTFDFAYPTGQSVVLEAMAAGCAVVSTDTEAMRSYVHAGVTGVAVPAGDPPALKQAIDQLLGDEGYRAGIAEASRIRCISEFNDSAPWQALLQALEKRGLLPPIGETPNFQVSVT